MKVTIEKLVYGGEGLARIEGPDGRRKTVFVPFALPGEQVEISIVEERPGFARGELAQVLVPAQERTAPPCPYFGECGGCHYQHATYEAQLKCKKEILRETVQRIAKVELPEIREHASPPLQYRNRTRMRVGTDAQGKFALGYFRWGSHSLLPVQECPISSPLINRAIQAVWPAGSVEKIPKGWAEIEFFANSDDDRLLVELLVDRDAEFPGLQGIAESVRAALPQIVGVVAVRRVGRKATESVAAPELNEEDLEPEKALAGQKCLEYRVAGNNYRVSAGAFFQTNRFLTEKLVELATAEWSGKHALDLYAGVGLFSLPLAKNFERVTAVEASPASFENLVQNAPANVKPVKSTTEAFLAKRVGKPDFALVDPPRNGLGKRVTAALAGIAPKGICYVSCDPSTLARDLPSLLASGYKVTQAHLLDLFPQTFHIESVLRLER